MAVKARNRMPSQFPALRLTVAQQMDGFQQRLAEKMRAEASKRGESAVDLASGLGTSASTAERWLRGERVPQRRNQKELRDYWDLSPDFFEIDLEAEEKEVRAQLGRIEGKLDQLLAHFQIEGATGPGVEIGPPDLLPGERPDPDAGHGEDQAASS